MTTAQAAKLSLSGPIPRICLFTAGTALGGIGWIDENQSPPTPLEFVLKLSAKLIPPLIEDGTIESGLFADSVTWLIHCAFSRLAHLGDLQILDENNSVVLAELIGDLVKKVPTGVGYTGVESSEATGLLFPVT